MSVEWPHGYRSVGAGLYLKANKYAKSNLTRRTETTLGNYSLFGDRIVVPATTRKYKEKCLSVSSKISSPSSHLISDTTKLPKDFEGATEVLRLAGIKFRNDDDDKILPCGSRINELLYAILLDSTGRNMSIANARKKALIRIRPESVILALDSEFSAIEHPLTNAPHGPDEASISQLRLHLRTSQYAFEELVNTFNSRNDFADDHLVEAFVKMIEVLLLQLKQTENGRRVEVSETAISLIIEEGDQIRYLTDRDERHRRNAEERSAVLLQLLKLIGLWRGD